MDLLVYHSDNPQSYFGSNVHVVFVCSIYLCLYCASLSVFSRLLFYPRSHLIYTSELSNTMEEHHSEDLKIAHKSKEENYQSIL